MAAYREITDSEVAENAPVTALLMAALRDNVLAITENDPTAPDIDAKALDYVPVGTNDSYQDVTASRAIDTTYTNNSGQTIEVCIGIRDAGSGSGTLRVAGVDFPSISSSVFIPITATIANGETYSVNSGGGGSDVRIDKWLERRP